MSNAQEHQLPGTITSIAVQKNNKERYSIFVDEQFLIGVSEETLIKFSLRKGAEVTPLLFKKIQREEGRFAVKAYLLKRLGSRNHSRKELLNKALRKDYTQEVILSVLDELEEKGYIDDPSFARMYASNKKRLNNWGPSKIKAHLMQKGIGRNIAEKCATEVFKNEDLTETFIHLITKRKRHFRREQNLLKRKKKVIAYLARKGYRSSSIYSCIDKLMAVIEE
ncbi:regulatory protein RecX [Fodinibius salsisoli]|uniref:Regulatory protein RecX n=1 Tax=Fodinibius salsisoli TaxID=2820877 RepID=A0ABT3PPH0_9BACT|nr:RecX family transcriptional regulator [Fodinibius salsisoli]MCW9707753.1 RecX family transcriptional regulator [Fodinibius salsisoli]